MRLTTILLGYLSIGLIYETLCILKDLILRRIYGYDYFSVDLMRLRWQILIRGISALIWPIDIFLWVLMIVRTNRGETIEIVNCGMGILEKFNEEDRAE